eukprot:m.275701 g.275701  ORF g.275701 m.275701 type:complete len:106 (-) comp54853_c0_seq28:163-480(-)
MFVTLSRSQYPSLLRFSSAESLFFLCFLVLRAANPVAWSAHDVADWLPSIGMQSYGESFIKNSITGACLKVGLDDETLDFLEVRLPVHRKNLVRQAAALFEGQAS